MIEQKFTYNEINSIVSKLCAEIDNLKEQLNQQTYPRVKKYDVVELLRKVSEKAYGTQLNQNVKVSYEGRDCIVKTIRATKDCTPTTNLYIEASFTNTPTLYDDYDGYDNS